MSAPGWYPDPSGADGLRYWDGQQWTAHTSPAPSNAPTSTDPSPDPTAPEQTVAPSQVPTTDPSAAPPSVGPPPEAGALIDPVANCPATATDAIGVLDGDGRYMSEGGFSVAAAEGFSAAPVQYPWIHQSNSQTKIYDGDWMAAVTVGTLRAEDGFSETAPAAVAMVACMLGSEFYEGHASQATVVQSGRAPDGDAVAMSVEVGVEAVPGISSDLVYVMTVFEGGALHVLVATVPNDDSAGITAVGEAVRDVRFG